jgi:hypothetical protein
VADVTLADLFGADLLLHYDCGDAASLFEDTAGTDAAEDGDAILCWKPQADAALQVNLTHTAGPTYAADYSGSGYPALSFNGTTQYLTKASPGLVPFTRLYLLAVVQYPGSGTASAVAIGSSSAHFIRLRGNSTNIGWQSLGGAGSFATDITQPTGERLVMAACVSSGQSKIDGYGECAGNRAANVISASLSDQFTVGTRGDVTQFWNGQIYEVLVVGDACEWGQVIRASTLLRHKWGITDQSATPQAAAAGGLNPFGGLIQ